MDGRTDGDRRLLDIVARAVRSTVTDRLRLEPVTTGHAADLHAVQADPWVAEWYAGAWSDAEAKARAGWFERQWEVDGVGKWLAYRRTGGEFTAEGLREGSAVVGPDAVFALYLIGPDLR